MGASLLALAALASWIWFGFHTKPFPLGLTLVLLALWIVACIHVIRTTGKEAFWLLFTAIPLILVTTILGYVTVGLLFFGGG